MKKVLLLSAFLLSLTVLTQAQSALLFSDDFTGYTVGNLAGQNGWTKFGSGPDVQVANTNPLAYSGYSYGNGEYMDFPTNSGTSSRVYKDFSDTTYSLITPGTVIYYSLLLRLDTTYTTATNYFFSLGQAPGTSNYYAKLFAKQLTASTYQLGVSKSSNTANFADMVLNTGETYLVVVRYDAHNTDINQSGNVAYMWINPVGAAEPDTATANAKVYAGQNDYTTSHCSAVMWHNRGLSNPKGSIDGIRVAGAKNYLSAQAWEQLAPGPLPVELTSFTYAVVNGNVVLYWKTATEINNKGFEVERKGLNEKSWTTLGFVPGYGTSTVIRSYSYTDNSQVVGKFTYRLKQIDDNGTYKYSGVVTADLSAPDNFSLSQNYPNPFNPSTKIEYQLPSESVVKIELYNIAGQKISNLVNEEQSAGFHSIIVNAENLNQLSSGIYLYKMTAVEKASGKIFVNTRKMTFLK